MTQELARLADEILKGEIKETIAGVQVTLSPEEPARAAFYATWRTSIYDEHPAEVLDYTKHVPDEWREYVTEDRDEFQAMAKLSFEHELYLYLESCSGDAA